MGIEWSSKTSAGPTSTMMMSSSESSEDKGEPPDKPPEPFLQVSVYEVENFLFWKNLNTNKITLVRVSSTFSDQIFTKVVKKSSSSSSSNLVLNFNTPNPTGAVTITLYQNNLPPCPGVPSLDPSSSLSRSISCGKVILGSVIVPVNLEDFKNEKYIENWYNIYVNENEVTDAKVRIGLFFGREKNCRSLCPGQSINDFFQLDTVLGEGVSVVKKGINKKTAQEVAIKILSTKIINREKIKNEAEVMQIMIGHPNIVKFYESINSGTETFLVMELVRGCDLFDFLKFYEKISESVVGNILYQSLQAVEFIHSKGFAHCDLKLENILIDFKSQKIKITDFDFARKVPFTPTQINGTLQYMAPEVLLSKTYDFSVDIWSLGVMVYKMLCGHYPFTNRRFNQDSLCRVLTGKFDFHFRKWKNVSQNCKDFIQKTLVVDPKQRPTSSQLLKHPWVSSCS